MSGNYMKYSRICLQDTRTNYNSRREQHRRCGAPKHHLRERNARTRTSIVQDFWYADDDQHRQNGCSSGRWRVEGGGKNNNYTQSRDKMLLQMQTD